MPVLPGECLVVDAMSEYSTRAYVFYDSNKTYIAGSVFPNATGSVPPHYYNGLSVEVPENAAYIRVGQKSIPPVIRKVAYVRNSFFLEKATRTHMAFENVMDELSDLVITGWIGSDGKINTSGGKMLYGDFERFEDLYVTGSTSQNTTFMSINYARPDGVISVMTNSVFKPENVNNSPAFIRRFHMTRRNVMNTFGVDNVISVGISNYDQKSTLPLVERAAGEIGVAAAAEQAKDVSRYLLGDVKTRPYSGEIYESTGLDPDSGKYKTANGIDSTAAIALIPG